LRGEYQAGLKRQRNRRFKEGHPMRSFDLTPFHRSTIGFDRLFSLLDQVNGAETHAPSYPPYNIERTSDNGYRISIAVAGFAEAELTIEAAANTLVVKGEKAADEAASAEVLFRGIAGRAFERRFQLADHVTVTGARLENGLLHVDLVRELPEAMKPRMIPIGNVDASKRVKPKALTSVAAAA
jgi:molecular chaperone IbpA